MITLTVEYEKLRIAGYCRISVDVELDKDNTSIENQKSIIQDFVRRRFPNATLDFYVDRDRSGYTFTQREDYQVMRPKMINGEYDILIVKDFSRFSRRNSKGLVELEDLRDAGMRIISIGDNIDYPKNDDWLQIQILFLMNEVPVTDASKKVKSVIARRQSDAKWICAVPYGYVITNSKKMTFEVEPSEAEVIRKIYSLYIDGWGYKKIANYLTDQHIPTPRAKAKERKEEKDGESKLKPKKEWSIATVQDVLRNDFYIGTLRQGKTTRARINGPDRVKDESEQIVFENHHEAIVDYKVFLLAQEELKTRTRDNYRGIKKYETAYSGFLVCGDCGSPMFSMSRADLAPAYTCGLYHRRGLKGCTSHHIRIETLDAVIKSYLRRVRENSAEMIARLEASIKDEMKAVSHRDTTLDRLQKSLENAKEELKALYRQKTAEVIKRPEAEALISETFESLIADCEAKIQGIESEIALNLNRRNTVIEVNRLAATAINVFDAILTKEKLDKQDLRLLIDRIFVFEDHIEVRLKSDIESLLQCSSSTDAEEGFAKEEELVVAPNTQKREKQEISIRVVRDVDPLEIFTEKDGEVIFKKYSPMGDLTDFAAQIAESIGKNTGHIAVICDRDTVIAVAGAPRRDLADKRSTQELEQLMESRRIYRWQSGDSKLRVTDSAEKYHIGVAAPILSEGDLMGEVLLLLEENDQPLSESEQKLVQTVAGFLGRQMES